MAQISDTNEPIDVDAQVGRRIRVRRQILGLSQAQLASAIGVSFQQIQKYEKGTNRISASRLYDVARVLSVSVSFFFEAIDDPAPGQTGPQGADLLLGDPMRRTETLEVMRCYWNLPSAAARASFLGLLRSLDRQRGHEGTTGGPGKG
ncbi:helix-turn-helix domain-containing protein [Roseospirillum parvum]|uniref:Helix-turn-helix n=1 Tax=Roseospirillum parvum TaxID=83401 RepID=A0A1G8EUY5_9PROT|nr:helix-turn-helix transcriptional regulator [Roseospirillum parvum]SDH73742.1 Helix-turn-helix [Roseospirillum parvum]